MKNLFTMPIIRVYEPKVAFNQKNFKAVTPPNQSLCEIPEKFKHNPELYQSLKNGELSFNFVDLGTSDIKLWNKNISASELNKKLEGKVVNALIQIFSSIEELIGQKVEKLSISFNKKENTIELLAKNKKNKTLYGTEYSASGNSPFLEFIKKINSKIKITREIKEPVKEK